MISFTLTLPLPPSANTLFANPRKLGGRRYATDKYLQWQSDAWVCLVGKPRPSSAIDRYSLSIRVSMTMRGDVDNRIKPISDFLAAQGFTPDDRHCVRVSAERDASVAPGTCIVTVEQVEAT